MDGLAAVTATGDVAVPEAVISRLVDSGVPAGELAHAYNVVLAAIVGFVALELASGVDAAVPADLTRLEQCDAPTILEHVAVLGDRCFGLAPAANRFDESFGRLIDALLCGLRQQLGGHPAGTRR